MHETTTSQSAAGRKVYPESQRKWKGIMMSNNGLPPKATHFLLSPKSSRLL
jgi:hypothetical protein